MGTDAHALSSQPYVYLKFTFRVGKFIFRLVGNINGTCDKWSPCRKQDKFIFYFY